MTWHADRVSLSIALCHIRKIVQSLSDRYKKCSNFHICKNQSQESSNNTGQSGVNENIRFIASVYSQTKINHM